jgi:hypothetical protein
MNEYNDFQSAQERLHKAWVDFINELVKTFRIKKIASWIDRHFQ